MELVVSVETSVATAAPCLRLATESNGSQFISLPLSCSGPTSLTALPPPSLSACMFSPSPSDMLSSQHAVVMLLSTSYDPSSVFHLLYFLDLFFFLQADSLFLLLSIMPPDICILDPCHFSFHATLQFFFSCI